MDFEPIIVRVRALQPASFAPDRSPRTVLGELEADYPCRDGRTAARRRVLLLSLEEFERARLYRAEWYVWISEVYASNRHNSEMESDASSLGLSSGVKSDEIR